MKAKIISFFTTTLLICSITFFLFSGCRKELSFSGNPLPGSGVNDNIMVTGGINGTVVDESNRPVVGATVSSGVNTAITDRYGAFRFRNISLSKSNGTVKVIRQGYYNAYRSFISVSGRVNNVRIKLIPKTIAGSFPATLGGTITISGGGKMVMPAGAVTDAGGSTYNGTVNVAMTWIDPTSPELSDILMGDLRGLTTSNEEMGLSTFGMLGVELTGSTGQALKIATGKKAELTFPIPAALQGVAAPTIDLWHFDEPTVRWKQEGTATRSGNNYVGQVSHFSFWNCDAPFPLIDLCMTLNNPNGVPLINAQVRIKRVSTGSYGYGRTDSIGNLCGKVPKNEPLILEVLDNCNMVVFSQNIGPFSANSTLGIITVTIPAPNNLVITGTVTNCAGSNVTNGLATVYITGGHNYFVPVTNGTFTVNVLRCSSGTLNFTVLGIDYATLQQSAPVSGSGTTGSVNIGTIQACGTSSLQYIELLIDGVSTVYTSPPDFINSVDSVSTGTYSNKTLISATRQNTGGTSYFAFSFLNNAVPGTYPLTNCFIVSTPTTIATIITPNPTVTTTVFGPPVSGFIEGSFNIQMMVGATPKNVICTFRVKRN